MFVKWIMGIVGISALGILVDILVNKGETEKYVKGVFGLFTLFVIVSPIQELINKDFNFNTLFSVPTSVVATDDRFLDYYYTKRYDAIEDKIVKVIDEEYSLEADVSIYFVESCPEEIDVIYIFLKNNGIWDEVENKYIIEEVTDTVSVKLNIKEEQVVVEWQKILM